MEPSRIIRHKLIDRLFHWCLALSILLILVTGLLPVYGFNASLIAIHWITGLVLTVLLVIHIIRSLFKKSMGKIWFSRSDLTGAKTKIGKYSLAQKLMHQFIALLSLAGIITGLMMMVRIETPFWERDPYWLQAETWGIVFFIHGLVALCFVSAIMLHVYFSLRPESRMYLRSMIKGWISKNEYEDKHDQSLWPQHEQPEEKNTNLK